MIAFLAAMLLAAGPAGPDPAESAYQAGRYEEALALYADALKEPKAKVSAGAVLYDMGNCAFRLGRYAEAALHYRCARLRMPRDEETAYNLSLAESRLGIYLPEEDSLGSALGSFVDSLTADELLALAAFLEGAGLVGLVFLRRRRGVRLVLLVVLLAGLAGGARLVQAQWFPGPPEAVVLLRQAEVRSEPRGEGPIAWRLRAGETVRMRESSEGWVRVDHPKGTGWVERAALGEIR